MKVAFNEVYGPPEIIKIKDMPTPAPKSDEILVKVHISAVNRTDCGFLRAKPFVTRFFSGLRKPRHPVLGCEFAGEVTEVGSDVTEFKVGDRVFGFDDAGWGGHAEYKVIRAKKSVVKIPKKISFEQAGVSGEGTHYAMSYIDTIKKLGGSRVLVHGATGAIGSAGAQLLKQAGYYVVATSTTQSMDLVKSFGVDDVIDWQKQDFTAYGEEFDVVFDAVGKSSFKACKPLLADRGVYIATELGPYVQNPFLGLLSPINKLFRRKRVLFPIPKNTKAVLQHVADCLEDGSFKPVIDRSYPLSDIVSAYHYVETGQKIGNVVIKVQ